MKVQEALQQLQGKGWSDRQVSAEIGFSRTAVREWRNGKREPTERKKVMEALEDLLDRPGPPEPIDLSYYGSHPQGCQCARCLAVVHQETKRVRDETRHMVRGLGEMLIQVSKLDLPATWDGFYHDGYEVLFNISIAVQQSGSNHPDISKQVPGLLARAEHHYLAMCQALGHHPRAS